MFSTRNRPPPWRDITCIAGVVVGAVAMLAVPLYEHPAIGVAIAIGGGILTWACLRWIFGEVR